MKTCSNKNCTAQNPQILTNFYRHKLAKDGLSSQCKICVNIRSKQYKLTEKGKETRKRALQKYNKSEKHKINHKRYRSSSKGKAKRAEYCQSSEYKEARRKSYLKSTYGITIEQYDKMLLNQNGACEICGIPSDPNSVFDVGHCHQTGVVRGLLCTHCNTGLSRFKDNTNILENAITYLNKYHSLETNS